MAPPKLPIQVLEAVHPLPVESRTSIAPLDLLTSPMSVRPSPLKSPVVASALTSPHGKENEPVAVKALPVPNATAHEPLL